MKLEWWKRDHPAGGAPAFHSDCSAGASPLLLLAFLLASCAGMGTGRPGVDHYAVGVNADHEIGNVRVQYGEQVLGGFGNGHISYPLLRTPFPANATLQWRQRRCDPMCTEHGPTHTATLPVAGNVPAQFTTGDNVLFHVDKHDQASVEFLVTVSDLTRRPLRHPQTAEERRLQAHDDDLLRAMKARDVAAIRRLLALGADPVQEYRHRGLQGLGPFALAIGWGSQEVVDLLVAAGGKPVEYPKYSVLGGAIVADRPAMIESLLQAGANPDYSTQLCVESVSDVRTECQDSRRVLVLAIQLQRTAIVKLLLQHGASTEFSVEEDVPFRQWVGREASPAIQDLLRAHGLRL